MPDETHPRGERQTEEGLLDGQTSEFRSPVLAGGEDGFDEQPTEEVAASEQTTEVPSVAPRPGGPIDVAPVDVGGDVGGDVVRGEQGPFVVGAAFDADPEDARAVIDEAQRQIEACDDPARSARLHHALGVILERRLDDRRRAVHHYQQAYRLAPDDLASVRAARQIFYLRQNWSMVLALLDAELRLSPSPGRASELLLEKARIYEDWLLNGARAQQAYQAALEQDPGNPSALFGLRRIHRSRADLPALLEACRQAASVSRDHRTRCELHDEIARIEREQGNLAAALEALGTAYVEDPSNARVTASLKRLYQQEGRYGDLVDVMLTEAELAATPRRQAHCLIAAGRICRDRLQQPDRAIDLFAHAHRRLREAPRPSGADATLLAELAELLRQTGRYSELAGIYEQLLDTTEDAHERVVVHYRLGQLLEQRLEQETEALWHYRHAVALDASYVPALQALGRLYQRRGMWGDLVAMQATEAEALTEPRVRASHLCAVADLCETRLEDPARAIEFYRRALGACPGHPAAERALERLYSRRDRFEALVPLLEAQLERLVQVKAETPAEAPTTAEASAAEVEAPAGEAPAGEAPAGEAPAGEAPAGEAPAGEAPAGEANEAGEASEGARPSPASEATRLTIEIARLCEDRLDDPERALSYYLRALEARPDDRTLLRAIGRLHAEAGRPAELLEILDREVALCQAAPGSDARELALTLAHQAAELCEQQLERPEEARRRYGALLELEPLHRPTLKSLGRLLHRLGEWEQLIALFIAEIDHAPAGSGQHVALLSYKVGELYEEQLRQPDAALEAYRRASAAASDFRPALQALSRLLRARGEWEALIVVLEQHAALLVEGPQRAALLHAIAEIWEARLSRGDQALAACRRAFELAPDHAPTRDALVRLLLAAGSASEAVEVLERSLRDNGEGDRAPVLKQMADVLERRLRDPQRALACHEQVLALGAEDGESLEALARLCGPAERFTELAEAHARLAALAEDATEAVRRLHRAAAVVEIHLQPEVDAAPLYERILELTRDGDRRALEALTRLYESRAEPAALQRIYQSALALEKDPALRTDLLLRLAAACEALGDLEGAAGALVEASEASDCWLVVRELRRLQEVAGALDLVGETLAREASLSTEPRLAVQSLLRVVGLQAGAVGAGEQLGKRRYDQLVAALEQALEIEPFHEEAASQLEQLLVQRGDWQRLVSVGRRRLLVASRDEAAPVTPRIELLARIAWIEREHLQQPTEAVEVLRQAMDLDPHHLPTLLTLGELHVLLEQWQEAVEVYQRVVALSDDPELLRRTHFQLGEIWSEPLADRREAISCFQNVLAVAPEDQQAMQRLYDLFSWCRDWENAADIVTRIIAVDADPQRQIALYVELAGIYEQGFGDPQTAAEQLAQARALDPLDDRVIGRIVDLQARLGQWQEVCETLRGYLAALPAERPELGRRRRRQLGEVLHQRLNQPAEALEVYRVAIGVDPGDCDARLAMARLLAQQGQLPGAIEEHRQILELDPLHVDNLRQLRAIWSRSGSYDLAFRAAAVLVGFDAAGELDQRIYREHRAQQSAQAPLTPVDPATYEAHVARVEEPVAGWAVLSLLSESAHRVRPPSLEQWQVGKADRLPPRSDDPLKVMVREIRASFGLPREIEVYISPTRNREMDLLLTDPPSLVVGSGVISAFPANEIRYAIGALLAHLRHRCWVAHGLDGRSLSILVQGACRLCDPRYAVSIADEREVSEMARLLQRALSRRNRRALEDACQRLAAQPPTDFERWSTTIAAMAMRAGLWLVNDLEASLSHLRRSYPELSVGSEDARPLKELAAAVRRRPLVGELIRYWLSEDYVEARRLR